MKNFIGQKEIENYKKFAFKEDMVKMSIAFILGASFNKVANGISNFIMMPMINFIISKTGDTWRYWHYEPITGMKIEIGQMLGVLLDFLITSLALYILYSKVISFIIKKDNEENVKIIQQTKQCPFCFSLINNLAKKCPECTGNLNAKPRRNRRKNQRKKNNRSQ